MTALPAQRTPEREAAEYLAGLPAEEQARALDAIRTFAVMKGATFDAPVEGFDPTPLSFDFAAEPPRPDWIVEGLLERGAVHVLSGDTGAGKSWLSLGLVAAGLRGEAFLGRQTSIQRVLVIDEENPARVVGARLRALGLSDSEAAELRYFNRVGIALGSEPSTNFVMAQVEEFRPDLLIVDTAMASTAVEALDNTEVTRLYAEVLRPIAARGVAVLILHHERKPAAGQSRNAGLAMLGARQWAGQADIHIALTPEREGQNVEASGDGGRRIRTAVRLSLPKVRDDVPGPPELIVIESRKDETGRLLTAEVRSEGPAASGRASDALAARLLAALDGGAALTTAELAAAVDRGSEDGSFKRAVSSLVDDGLVVKPTRGQYQRASTGIAV